MVNEQFAQLIARHLAGESSEEEKKELEDLLKQDPTAHYFYELFSGYWVNTPKKELNQVQEEIHFQQIIAIAEKDKDELKKINGLSYKRSPLSGKIVAFKQLLAAAIFVGVILSAYFLFFQKGTDNSITQVPTSKDFIETPKGIRSVMMRLPDGTKVWLNSDSKLEYNDFNPKNRQVSLTGEAYFDVTKDPTHPFVVHTSDIDIRVLGTAFNVKSYPKESSIETTLIHGLVEVRNKKQPETVLAILHPHEKLIFHKEENQQEGISTDQKSVSKKTCLTIPLSKQKPDSALVETSWIYNKLIFDGETFTEAALKMERWYNVKINFKNDRIANIRIRYTIEEETIEQALKAIQVIENFNFRINGNEIEIY
jgi:ferric-dicitrate binding protein FerR (iron transport regulator)